MADRTPDPTLDRLLRHMAWANAQLITRLAEQPDDALALTAPHNEWSAGRILAHLLNAAEGYAARLEGVPRPPDMELARPRPPSSRRRRIGSPPSTRGFVPRRSSPTSACPILIRHGRAGPPLDDPRPGDPPRNRAPGAGRGRPRHERQRRDRPRRDRPLGIRRRRGPGRLIAARSPQPRISRRAWSPLV